MTTFQMMWKTSEMPNLMQFQAHNWHPVMQTKHLKNAKTILHKIKVLGKWKLHHNQEKYRITLKSLKVSTPHQL